MELSFLKDPILSNFWHLSNLISILCWIQTLRTKNYSQVDRLWPILPIIYSWGFLFTACYYNPKHSRSNETSSILESELESILRLVIMTILINCWGCRLTYNYWRKGNF